MSKDKFTTSPIDVDQVSHDFSVASSPHDDGCRSEGEKGNIINKIIDWVLNHEWWVVIILAIVSVGIGILCWYLILIF